MRHDSFVNTCKTLHVLNLPYFITEDVLQINVQLTLFKFGTGTKCLCKNDVCLINSQLRGDQKATTKLIFVSILLRGPSHRGCHCQVGNCLDLKFELQCQRKEKRKKSWEHLAILIGNTPSSFKLTIMQPCVRHISNRPLPY